VNLNFRSKVVLITGAGQGNGAALAHGFAKAGAAVAVVDRDGELAYAVAGSIRADGGLAEPFELDVSSASDCVRTVDEVGRLLGDVAVLVNNAGILIRKTSEAESWQADWLRTLDVNLSGTFFMVHAALGQLKATRGCVLNVASIQSFVSTPNSAAYTASKGGVAQLTKALASELAPAGIRVNAIAPGFIATPMTQATMGDPMKMAAVVAHIPLGRHGLPAELVGPALFLCSAQASYVSGAILPVDGGYLTI
jgi:NAD(P)-dependent dehydrogenase (short-subunit alcohol dehydrogenase family)